MNKQTKSILVLVILAIALTSVTAAVAAPSRPWIHPPVCRVLPTISRDIILYVSCEDKGGDINEAFILESSYPVSRMIAYNGTTALIMVYRPTVRQDLVLVWCVGDAQGNVVMQKFSWP